MNCPRCGEMMYGSVCPRCGNVVLNDRESRAAARKSQRTPVAPRKTNSRMTNREDDGIRFMDNNSGKAIKGPRKKPNININVYKIAIVVLAVICVVLFFKYSSANSKLAEAQNTINTQNESIKAKDQEISDLKAAQAKEQEKNNSDDENSDDSSAPEVEFDENGNVINIEENGSSDSEDEDGEEKTEYKSGDTYTVKDGDNGSIICNKIYGKYSAELWEKLLSANGLTTSSSFHPGDELKIP